MNWDRLALVTAPASEPVTLSEAKAQLRVDSADDDDSIAHMITAAVGMIDGPKGIGICLVSQQWKLTIDAFPRCIRIPLGPVITVDSITYIDTEGLPQTVVSSDYRVMNAGDTVIIELVPGKSWPTTQAVLGAVQITFTAGHAAGAVPVGLKHAVLMLVAHWFENRETVVVGVTASELPLSVEHILNKYRVGTVAA